MTQVIWTPGMKWDELEMHVIKAALVYHRGNKTETAESLGFSVRTLYDKLDQYAKEEAEFQEEQKKKKDDYLKSIDDEKALLDPGAMLTQPAD